MASPATVSRCGMVYVEPSEIGWRPLSASWLHTLPAVVDDGLKAVITEMMEWLIDPCMRMVRKHCKELIPTSDINLPESLMRLFVAHIDTLVEGADNNRTIVECTFVFSLIWSIGCAPRVLLCLYPSGWLLTQQPAGSPQEAAFSPVTASREQSIHPRRSSRSLALPVLRRTCSASTETDGRQKFNAFLRQLLSGATTFDFDLGPGLEVKVPAWKLALPLPAEGDCYEYLFRAADPQWVHWLETVPARSPDPKSEFSSIIVQARGPPHPLQCRRGSPLQALSSPSLAFKVTCRCDPKANEFWWPARIRSSRPRSARAQFVCVCLTALALSTNRRSTPCATTTFCRCS